MVTIENNCFSIPQICESGQCFRLDAVSEDTYELLAGSRHLKIGIRKNLSEAAGGDGNANAHTHGETVLYCTQEEYETFWKEYFDLSVSYSDYIAQIDGQDDYLKSAAEFGSGIRILRQDTWEMIITFILSQQNNIPRIKGLIRTLSERYGKRRETPDGGVYYTFPGAEELSQATEEELRELKLGYRSKYICQTAKMIAGGGIDLDALKEMEYTEARTELMRLSGIGGKVADCICLFALHQMDAFPVDTHIKKALELHYPGGFPFEKYKGCAGVMQQYIFYYDLRYR
ncbi:DNA-3-methyladenine glycosylase family protein [Mediterraneibacter glycyrrhizinilyticus]|uniref:DNA-3-methyladenine glycosylase family protein n=1 Tax=Mediterraneibacter glycyrrhizinilyticus TaxID=342942 RepID=UPI0025A43312|nr:8-oxoguanine DNA glycosylase [Mediterraneibacter glycyrrhizinilyticus]MDM8211803.1 DNA glycosylase [Mediterraneibacter glycyrrhizinilyticus]